MKNTFSYIIGYRHNNERFKNLKRTIDWLKGFNDIEIIIVEQDKHSKISHLKLDAKHIFLKSDKPYNRSWSFNVGLKYSNSDIIVFGDSDLIMEPKDFISGLNALTEYQMVSPYNSVLDLTQQESLMSFDRIIEIDRPGRGENDNQKINISGGIVMFKKEAIISIGGWCEKFTGWGGEDDYQTLIIENFLTWTELKAKCYHLYHSRVIPNITDYKRNLNLLEESKKLSKDQLFNIIQRQKMTIGLKNKYS
jgi:predicted glycosyltransferase involved in capsule biosynthesis